LPFTALPSAIPPTQTTTSAITSQGRRGRRQGQGTRTSTTTSAPAHHLHPPQGVRHLFAAYDSVHLYIGHQPDAALAGGPAAASNATAARAERDYTEVVLSCEVGYAKPDPRIYQPMFQCFVAAPGDALLIDDTPGHLAAAESLGLTGHLHLSSADTIATIERFLGRGPAQ
jgi:HAD superfamily hydrolase (TIGR01509 family)